MPRPPRDLAPGIQHIGASAAGSGYYFMDDQDRSTWLHLFQKVVSQFDWRCLAVCLLTTHWHALIDLPDGSLAAGMHRLIGGYSRRFNERHARAGYLVRSRYWSRRKDSPESVLEAFRYIARNPVGAGLVEKPEDWRWSSYGRAIGVSQTFGFTSAGVVLAEFGATRREQIDRLRGFVDAS
jgi:REP-associated tyrosine transposase